MRSILSIPKIYYIFVIFRMTLRTKSFFGENTKSSYIFVGDVLVFGSYLFYFLIYVYIYIVNLNVKSELVLQFLQSRAYSVLQISLLPSTFFNNNNNKFLTFHIYQIITFLYISLLLRQHILIVTYVYALNAMSAMYLYVYHSKRSRNRNI